MFGYVWEKLTGGLFVPAGVEKQISTKNARTYLNIKENVTTLRELYERHGVEVPMNSSLAQFLASGVHLSDEWFVGGARRFPTDGLFRGAICSRIVEAALVLTDQPNPIAKHYLERLLRGSLDLLDRTASDAKNVLWELECLLSLRLHSIEARLAEPDILAQTSGGPIGFACKKIYSEKNVSKIFSEAVSQIEQSGCPGILAINLDEWVPANSFVRLQTFTDLKEFCNQNNNRFLSEHARHIEKYCCSGRALAIWVSTGLIADLTKEDVRLSNARESVLWSSTKMGAANRNLLAAFLNGFKAR